MAEADLSEQELADAQAAARLRMHDGALLREALTHPSYPNETPHIDIPDNQRLEFLGDALIDLLVAEWLYARYPDASEGELTGLRAQIVRTEGLASFALEIDLGRHLLLGRGEAASGGRERAANLCAAFEALAGALYLDQGIDAARRWLLTFLEQHATEIDGLRASKDAKSLLQEYTQSTVHITPTYRIVRDEGPDHAKVFTAQVLVGDEVWGEGTGSSKQAAEQLAAEEALRTRRAQR
ncbi:MAG TPA: ribonuclease III [Chloroflexi bacterium]|nr:ribonuclease III [Chloroflexota bacterium]